MKTVTIFIKQKNGSYTSIPTTREKALAILISLRKHAIVKASGWKIGECWKERGKWNYYLDIN
jgi:hypothetical protein